MEVKPFDSRRAVVKPYEGPIRRADTELALYDSIAAEQVRCSGTVGDYYSLNVQKSTVNPTYDESIRRVFDGPFRLAMFVEWPKSNPEVREEGMRVKWECRGWIPRVEFENARAPVPLEGDMVRIWRTPFFDSWSVSGDEPQGGGYYFNVVKCNDEGHLYDSPGFVGFEVTLQRSTDFTPERRLDRP